MKQRFAIMGGFFLIFCILFNIGSVIYQQKDKYLSHNFWERYPGLQEIYNNSQYVNKHPKGWIPDETVNAYAGGAYVKGVGPHLIAPDTPPLGRYLIGFSGLVFNNENIVILISAITSLMLLFFIGRQIFASKMTALLVPTLISFEPFFKNQLIYTPLLDIMQLAFLLASFFFFNISHKKHYPWVWYIISSFFLGCFIATKFFITGFVVAGALVIVLLLNKRFKQIVQFLLSLLVGVFVLLMSYIRVFAYAYTLKSFLGIQKWVFLYHKSQLILPFSIWPLIYLNKWYVWFGNKPVLSDPQWLITWPLGLTIAFLTIGFYLFRKIKKNINLEPLMLWVVLYIAFFSFGQITSRYLIIYLPIVYLVAFYGLEKLSLLIISYYEDRN